MADGTRHQQSRGAAAVGRRRHSSNPDEGPSGLPTPLQKGPRLIENFPRLPSNPLSLHSTLLVWSFQPVATGSPAVSHLFPPWSLNKIISALTTSPFEPLRLVSLRFLSFKIAFLTAITSARRISELAALSIRRDLCIFHSDRVILRLDPTFIPKVNYLFHHAQELVLPISVPI